MKKGPVFLLILFALFLGQATTVVCQTDLSDELVGYWPLDEGTGITTADESELTNTGTLVGGPEWVEGVFGSALDFDGVDAHVDCGDDQILEFGTGNFSISAWFQTPGPAADRVATSADQTIFAKGGDDGGGIRYHLCISGRVIKFLLDDNNDTGGKGKRDPDGTTVVVDTAWHHIVSYRQGDSLRVYIDGVEDMGTTLHAEAILPSDYSIINTDHPALIGAIISNNTGFPLNKFFHGIIDDVAVWARALTKEEIQYLWNGGIGNRVLPEVSSTNDLADGKVAMIKNYPNPFGSLTTFKFQLTENSNARLAIYNAVGQEVAVVADGMRPAGVYTEKFDGSALAEGVYFAKLQTGAYNETIKIIIKK
ncbi:MAG: LamG-like jellyroll fold domain-containing protein [Bacteroidales bacterium]